MACGKFHSHCNTDGSRAKAAIRSETTRNRGIARAFTTNRNAKQFKLGTSVDGLRELGIPACVLLVIALAYFVFRSRSGRRDSWRDKTGIDFRPTIGFARQDGFQSVALLLDNNSDEFVWIEEIEIALTELNAEQQTSEATCRETHKVRQSVHPHDMLPISLVGAIYKAAGGPQRTYSCSMFSMVRYRVGEKWFEEPMKSYRLKMTGLTVSNLRPAGTAAFQFASKNMSEELQTANTTPR